MRPLFRYIVPVALCSGILFVGTGRGVPVSEAVPQPVELRPFEGMIIPDSANVIVDSVASLIPFYEQLAALRIIGTEGTDSTLVVPIVHLGDSHIQAGYLTGMIMREFHRDFGNAGRGLITPLKMAGTNEPFDYIIRSNVPWESVRLTQSSRSLPVGLGGVAIGTKKGDFSLTLNALDRENPGVYAFNKVHVIKHPAAPPLQVEQVLADTIEHPYFQTIILRDTLSELTLSNPAGARDSSIYYGFSLENGCSGVLYHAAGINGAQFTHWPRVEGLAKQVAALRPALIILSMGTNEALMGRSFSSERFYNRIDALVTLLREENPNAVFLLTTPPESYRRANRRTPYTRNPQVADAAAVIRDYAVRNGLACWDLFTISGGTESCEVWKKAGLFNRDQLHFTAKGYAVQAQYLYQAIIQGFNDYVRDRYGEPAPIAEL